MSLNFWNAGQARGKVLTLGTSWANKVCQYLQSGLFIYIRSEIGGPPQIPVLLGSIATKLGQSFLGMQTDARRSDFAMREKKVWSRTGQSKETNQATIRVQDHTTSEYSK